MKYAIRLLCLLLAIGLLPACSLGEETETICEHKQSSYDILIDYWEDWGPDIHYVEKSRFLVCDECGLVEQIGAAEYYFEGHLFNSAGKCSVCGYQKAPEHHCADVDCAACTSQVLSVEQYSAASHYVHGIVEHRCTECGHVVELQEQWNYAPHYDNGKGVCEDCGYRMYPCPHVIMEDIRIPGKNEAYSDNQDGKTHQHTYTVRQVCADCGYEAGETTIYLSAQTHAFAVTPSLLSDESGHWEQKTRQCACGFVGYTTDEKEAGLVIPHSFKDGICTECQYACRHAYENAACIYCGMQAKMTYVIKVFGESEIQTDGSILYLIGEKQQLEIAIHCEETDSDHALSEFMEFSIQSPDGSMQYIPGRYENGKAILKEGFTQGALSLIDKRTQETIDTVFFLLQPAADN